MWENSNKSALTKNFYRYGVLIFLLVLASLQFFLLLRHKNPYMSDSYFYKHLFYRDLGLTDEQAYQKVLIQIDMQTQDIISRNFYLNSKSYTNSLSFFTKRPLYPLLISGIYRLTQNEYISFFIPVYVGFISVLVLVYQFISEHERPWLAAIVVGLLLAFYPFLDWSTYFLTDITGAAFWFAQLLCIYWYIRSGNKKWMMVYGLSLSLSLLNREQSLLMVVVTGLLNFIYLDSHKYPQQHKRTRRLFLLSLLVSGTYIVLSIILKQKTLYDTWVYTLNQYGLNSNPRETTEVVYYLIDAILRSHLALVKDLLQHRWWATAAILGIVGSLRIFIRSTKFGLVETILVASGVASYLNLYIYPVLSYRYFIPAIVTLLYFSVSIVYGYFKTQLSLFN